MKTTTRYTTTILTLALLLTLGGCVKDELHDTAHPDTGKVTVTANWADRGEGVDIPASWHIALGDYTGTETGATHSPDYLFNPGNYTLAAYNIPDGITVSGTTATVATEDGSFITGIPGWLFTSVQEVAIEADTDYELTAAMHQQVRQLTLMIEPTGDAADRIETIEGTLSGAAGTLGPAARHCGRRAAAHRHAGLHGRQPGRHEPGERPHGCPQRLQRGQDHSAHPRRHSRGDPGRGGLHR